MKRKYDVSLTDVKTFAGELAGQLRGGEILALVGDLGSGKTTFTQALAKALGVKEKVLSPTFILLQEFPTRLKDAGNRQVVLFHLDLYRTGSFSEIEALGLPQTWGQPFAITVIEWADKIKDRLPPPTIYIHLTRNV